MIYSEGSSLKYEEFKPEENEEESFEALKAQNSDVLAWLYIDGTGVDYPVVQSKIDNFEYLQKNPLGEITASGSLFLDVNNAPDFSDVVSIIYGHHMENSLMFGDLDKFGDASFFESHKYGTLHFDGEDHRVTFFAFLIASAYDENLYENEKSAEKYKQYVLKKAINKRNVEGERLLVLTTCAANITNGRYVLVGIIEN